MTLTEPRTLVDKIWDRYVIVAQDGGPSLLYVAAKYRSDVDPFWRAALLKGLDEVGLTLIHADQISEFEKRYHREMDWLA